MLMSLNLIVSTVNFNVFVMKEKLINQQIVLTFSFIREDAVNEAVLAQLNNLCQPAI